MKTASLILLIAGCVLVRGVAYASTANPAPQRSSGNSTTTDTGSDRSSYAEHATVSTQRKDQKQTVALDERAKGRHVSDKTRPHSRTSLKRTYRPKQVHHNHEHSRPVDVTSKHQQALLQPAATARRVVNIHTLPVRPATGVGISGQQFRNGRNRSATPAVIGGPASTKRNAAVINGTEVDRRHLH